MLEQIKKRGSDRLIELPEIVHLRYPDFRALFTTHTLLIQDGITFLLYVILYTFSYSYINLKKGEITWETRIIKGVRKLLVKFSYI